MFLNPADFPFTATLESNWRAIRSELLTIRKKDFMAWPERFLYGTGWDVFGLHAFGQKMVATCAVCPETTAVVESIPGKRWFSMTPPSTSRGTAHPVIALCYYLISSAPVRRETSSKLGTGSRNRWRLNSRN